MNKSDIIGELAKRRAVETIVRNITHRTGGSIDDLVQIVYLALLETTEDRIQELWRQGMTAVNCYIAVITRNQYFSDSSRYYYDYKRYVSLEDANRKDIEDSDE